MSQELISKFPFGPAKEVNTKRGPRLVSECRATQELKDLFFGPQGSVIRAAGVSFNEWQGKEKFALWQEITAERVAAKVAAIESSRAASTEIELPVPQGLASLPYQRAGLA